jgi:purine-binding chemotaxis protein CheW
MSATDITTTDTSSGTIRHKARAGKYLTFQLAAEVYGLEILKVREIMGLMKITRVPQSSSHIRGVINLRGKVIPVLDLRRRFGMEITPDTEQTCVIVVDIVTGEGTIMMGVVVDAVSEVLDVAQNQIENAPSLGSQDETAYLLGIAKIKNEVKILLDIDQVVTSADCASLGSAGCPGKVSTEAMA